MTTSDNAWYNEWQREQISDNEWQWVTEWYNKWQRVAQWMKANESKSDFRFQNETIMQCITTIYLVISFWKYNVKHNICRNGHQRCSIKKTDLKTFALFTGKQEKNHIKNLKIGLKNWWIGQVLFK